MSSGPAIVMALEAPDAIKKWRTLMGATDPAKADAGTLRKEFAQSIERNATHGSDAPETAAFEIGYFFAGMDLVVGRHRHWTPRRDRRPWVLVVMYRVMGKTLVLVGLGIAGLGLLIMFGIPFGRLPGDFAVRRGNFSFYFPLATSIILSIILTLICVLQTLSRLSARDSEGSSLESQRRELTKRCASNPTTGSRAWRSSTR